MAHHSSTKKAIRKTAKKTASNKSSKTRIKLYLIFIFIYFNILLKNNNPITAPYKVLFKGFEVMAHVPLLHPTK